MKEKKKYFETLRGIAIMMVVAIHTFGIASSNFKIEVRELFNCAVPLFFLLSGFFLYQKPLSSKSEVLSFWKRQIPKVYMPVIVWSLPTFLKNIFFNHHSVINEILLLFSCGYHVFYFVAVIIQFYILLPLIKRVDGFNLGGGIIIVCVKFHNGLWRDILQHRVRKGFATHCLCWLWIAVGNVFCDGGGVVKKGKTLFSLFGFFYCYYRFSSFSC